MSDVPVSSPDRRQALDEAAKILELRSQYILLAAGAISPQEIRTARTMLDDCACAIRALI